MPKPSSIPENVKKYVPGKCIRIRHLNNTYYCYRYKAIKLPSGKWSSSAGVLIGKIIPDVGFIPNKRYIREQETLKKAQPKDLITDVSYGAYDLLISITEDILKRLLHCFPAERAVQIYCYALILCIYGFVHVDQIGEIYWESYLSILYKDYAFKMGPAALSSRLHDLGMRGTPVMDFEQSLIDESSKNIAIDGHVIASGSMENLLAEPGYKLNILKSDQVNVLIAYDTRTNEPLMYRTYRGSSVDCKSCEHFLESRSFENVKFVVDKGFYTRTLLKLMSENGNSYIIPVPTRNKDFKRIRDNLQYDSGEFVYKKGDRDSARILYHEEEVGEGIRMIFFKDMDENNSKRKSFMLHIDEMEDGYTQEKYDQYSDWWGVYVLQTTLDESAQQVFEDYKDRWSIETYNNYLKNDAGFNDLKLQDYYNFHGFNFIMLVTGLLHARLNHTVKALNKPNISTFDILLKAGHMRLVKTRKGWKLHNTRRKDLELLSEIGFTPKLIYPEKKG